LKLELTTPTEREIVIRRRFDAPPDLIFDCFTTPALLRRWLLGPPGWSMPECEIEARVGGRYRYVWRHEDGRSMGVTGVIREVSRPERLVSTELFDEDWTGGETLVTLALSTENGRTLLTQTVLYSSQAARDGAVFTGMAEGMDLGFDRLDTVLAELRNA